MSNETQLILYTRVRNFPSEAVELSASEWLDSVKASARKAHITGESRVWFTRNHLDEDFSRVIEKGLLRPLVREQRAKHRTFTWNFDKLCIAILKIEDLNHTTYKPVSIFPTIFQRRRKCGGRLTLSAAHLLPEASRRRGLEEL
jgi:hypothetical protein